MGLHHLLARKSNAPEHVQEQLEEGRKGDPDDPAIKEFHAELAELEAEGWHCREKYRTWAVMSKTSYGKTWAHVVLFLLTAGIGNVIYAAGSYYDTHETKVIGDSPSKKRRTVRKRNVKKTLKRLFRLYF